MRTSLASLFIAVLFIAARPAAAQEDVLYPWAGSGSSLNIGAEIGPNWSIFYQDISHSPIDNPTSPFKALESGGGLGGFFNVFVEYPFASRFGLRVVGGVDYKRFTTSGEGVADCPGDQGGAFDTVDLAVRQTVSTLWLTGAVHLRIDISKGFYGLIGPTYHAWVGDATVSTRQEILSDGSCEFETTGEKVLETESSTTAVSSNRWGIEGGFGYRHLLTEDLWLTFTAKGQIMLKPFSPEGEFGEDRFRERTLGVLNVSADDRALHSILLGVGLIWSL